MYSAEDMARIGKYALENGNETARVHFLKKFPNLRESTLRNFKKAYKEKLHQESKKLDPKPITRIVTQPKGRPPILLELDDKLLKLLLAI